MQHKPKVQKASAKKRNSERSEHTRDGGTGWQWQNNDNIGKCEKKKWEKNEVGNQLGSFGWLLQMGRKVFLL